MKSYLENTPQAHIERRYLAIEGIAMVCLAAAGLTLGANAQAQTIVMASTTSTEQSGLFAHLLPEFKKANGVDVKVVALREPSDEELEHGHVHEEGHSHEE